MRTARCRQAKGATLPREQITRSINVHRKIYTAGTNEETQQVETSIRPYIPHELLGADESLHEEPALILHWTPDPTGFGGHAQASVRTSMELLADYVDGWRKSGSVEPADQGSLFVDFHSRDELNNLIRTARRVRDSVFGADE
jgi:hypothetical protein